MRLVSSLLVGLSLAFLSLFASSAEQPKPAPSEPAQQWAILGIGQLARYDVLMSTVEPDADTFSVQFILRTTYHKPILMNGAPVQAFVEHTLVLCRENLMVTMNQLQYDPAGKHVNTIIRAHVYENGGPDSVVGETIKWACRGYHQPRNNTPVNPNSITRKDLIT